MASNAPRNIPASPMSFDLQTLYIVRSSASRLTQSADDFIRRLHQDIGALSPAIFGSMAGQGWPFCDRMARTVFWVALTDEPLGVVADGLRQVGADNWREGFPDAEYVSVAHALVRTIRGLADNDWFTSMASAWISCFQWMQPYLLAGARQAMNGNQPPPRPATITEPAPVAASRPPRSPDEAGNVVDAADDEDDEVGYGQIMVSMTLNSRRERIR